MDGCCELRWDGIVGGRLSRGGSTDAETEIDASIAANRAGSAMMRSVAWTIREVTPLEAGVATGTADDL